MVFNGKNLLEIYFGFCFTLQTLYLVSWWCSQRSSRGCCAFSCYWGRRLFLFTVGTGLEEMRKILEDVLCNIWSVNYLQKWKKKLNWKFTVIHTSGWSVQAAGCVVSGGKDNFLTKVIRILLKFLKSLKKWEFSFFFFLKPKSLCCHTRFHRKMGQRIQLNMQKVNPMEKGILSSWYAQAY